MDRSPARVRSDYRELLSCLDVKDIMTFTRQMEAKADIIAEMDYPKIWDFMLESLETFILDMYGVNPQKQPLPPMVDGSVIGYVDIESGHMVLDGGEWWRNR